MIRVSFRLFNGLAGDEHLLLIGKSSENDEISYLWNRNSLFKHYRLRRLKNKILREFEIKTGEKHEEQTI